MIKFLITDANFQQVKSRQEKTNAGIATKLIKTKKKVKIVVNTMAPFAVYKWEQGEHFAISNKLDMIAEYIVPLGYELEFTPTESRYINWKPYLDRARNCSNVEKITCWSAISVDRHGNLKITPPKKKPFSVPLISRRGVKLLLKWLKKYLQLATKEIENDNFIPNLTGGLDSRSLTWFWRDLYHGEDFYLEAVKPDGKNEVARGQEEVETASQVLNRLGLPLKRVEKFQRTIFSGAFTDNGCNSKKWLNNTTFIYDYMALHFGFGSGKYFSNSFVCPFSDNLYLRISHPDRHYMRTLLGLLLCPDLLDIPLYSFSGEPQYQFYEKFANLISKVEQFIKQYNLRKLVTKLKIKVLGKVK
ncbi:MAG: hypothetical protein NC133_01890 [Prevotella sp.]|nr:hypothetical protein [Prevotella sp.]